MGDKFLTGSVYLKDAEAGTFTVVASMPSVDRDKEVIDAGAFNPLPGTVPIHTNHAWKVESLVGRGRPYYDGATLKVDGKFASTPEAQTVRQLVREGILDTVSVGFMDPKRHTDKDGVAHISKAELVEVSFVTVPSNRDARVLSAKAPRGWTDAQAKAAVAIAEATLLLTEDDYGMETVAKAEAAIRQLKRKGWV